jgi:voltage-gated potassium channel Kch
MELNITLAQYVEEDGVNTSITAVIDGKGWSVPMQAGNVHYDEIMRQVEAGTLVIAEAD